MKINTMITIIQASVSTHWILVQNIQNNFPSGIQWAFMFKYGLICGKSYIFLNIWFKLWYKCPWNSYFLSTTQKLTGRTTSVWPSLRSSLLSANTILKHSRNSIIDDKVLLLFAKWLEICFHYPVICFELQLKC